jgi:transcriptional regulator with XRE-family HTH domain
MESTIGARIRQLRESKQLSVIDFAKAAGVKPSAVYGLESGANKPSLETVATLRQSFPGLNTEWLQFGDGEMFSRTLSQLPPAIPSKLEELEPRKNHMEIVAESQELKQVKSERDFLREQNSLLLEIVRTNTFASRTLQEAGKDEASAEAATLYDEVDAIAAERLEREHSEYYRVAAQYQEGRVRSQWVSLSVA